MINFIVDDMDGVLAKAAAEGVEPTGRQDEEGMGRFAWLLDPAGVKIELWEPGKPELRGIISACQIGHKDIFMSYEAISRTGCRSAARGGGVDPLRLLALLAAEELSVLELCRILDQSQPRVSRHLKLLAEAGLVERFPDGAWVFYRLAGKSPGRHLIEPGPGPDRRRRPGVRADADKLAQVRAERSTGAQAYFARNAARWNEIRSLYVDEAEVEAAILRAAGEGPFDEHGRPGRRRGPHADLAGPTGRLGPGPGPLATDAQHRPRRGRQGRLGPCELRHGDIFATGLPGGCADLVTVHQVLHYLGDPAAAVAEAARLVAQAACC
jgi:DNA-binding transcriptional ArsR family regulator